MSSTPVSRGSCAQCGTVIAPDAPSGQCPRCVLALGRAVLPGQASYGTLLDGGEVRRFGDYELLEEIARGGMGVVYRARQVKLGREVALKMILAGELATPEAVQRFQNEAKAAAQLEHPNIVSVYETGKHETQHYFSMRLVPGRQNIATWAKALALAADRAAQITAMMAKVARAVAFAHERGVLHRDLKPSNILVDPKGEPYVVDFGISRPIGEDTDLTLTGQMVGTPRYMAPEQVRGEKRTLTAAADTYSLGAILYELLAGRKVFDGVDMLTLLRQVTELPPAPLSLGDRDLEYIILRGLEKSPGARYASAAALADDLERWLRHEPVQAPLSMAARLGEWVQGHPGLAVSLALCVGLGIFVVGRDGNAHKEATGSSAHASAIPVLVDAYAAARQALEWFHSVHGPRGHLTLRKEDGQKLRVGLGEALPAGDFDMIELWLDHWKSPNDADFTPPSIDPADFRRHAATVKTLESCFLRSLPLTADDLVFLSQNPELFALTIENCSGGGDRLIPYLARLEKLHLLNLSKVGLEGDILTGKNFETLACLPNLGRAYFMSTAVDDALVSTLVERCPKLYDLGLGNTSISDAALHTLNRHGLRELRLGGNRGITDAGLAALAQIPSLHSLYIHGATNLTAAGIDAFQAAHPECRISR